MITCLSECNLTPSDENERNATPLRLFSDADNNAATKNTHSKDVERNMPNQQNANQSHNEKEIHCFGERL